MIRVDIITTIGREYLVSNIENDEFSYPKAFRTASLPFTPIQNSAGRSFEKLDIHRHSIPGFKKKKNLGRVEQIDILTEKSKWVEIETKWIDTYRRSDVIDGFSAVHKVTGDDEWLCEAYMKTDYSKLTAKDFQKTINNYLAYLVKEGFACEGLLDWDFIEQYIRHLAINSLSSINKIDGSSFSLETEDWKDFRVGDLFAKIYKAEAHVKADCECFDSVQKGSIRFISRTEENNGCDCYVVNSGLTGIEEGQAIVIGDTTATCSYQTVPFVCGDHIVICRADWINTYTALFIVTLIKREQYKYSYGRAFKMQLISETKIKLPAKGGKPDWEYMENYIKSLPYGDRI